ncbi:MAG: ABC transporter ATP-binding protein [Acidimicrobiales bacterium]
MGRIGDGEGGAIGGWVRGRFGLAQLAWRASRRLTVATAALTVLIGLLPAAFNVASGAVVGSVAAAATAGARSPAGGRLTAALVVAGACYVLQQGLTPVRETIGTLLMGRIDERLILRVMAATTAPPGIGHLEDPEMLDRVQQAQGAITGGTPGGAAYHASHVWGRRLMALASLAILGTLRWWIPPLLVAGHGMGFAWRRRNWRTLNAVVFGRSEALRRSFYLRRLATEPAAAKETRVFDLDRWLVERYRTHFLDTMGPIWRARRMGGLIALAVSGMIFVLDVVVLVVIADAGLAGTIGVGAVVVYAGALGASAQLGIFSDNHQGFEDGMASLRVLESLEAMSPGATSAADDGAPAAPRSGCIRFEGVRFRYPGRDTDVFDGLDLEIEAGCSLAIVGENGAGKTTLVKLLARLYEPTGGRITVDGVDLRDLDARDWQRQVAAVFQDFTRYQFSAYDNVAVGALHLAGDRRAVEHAAARAGAAAIIEGLPGGWDTRLSRQFTGGADLSGGEWQRVALARALFAVVGGARVLVLDEPTAALDVRAEAEIYDRYLELTHGLTTVLISHRFSTVRRADRIVVLDGGRVIEDGSHDQLLAAGGRYAEMYELQARRFRTGDGGGGG